jgi:hypothetical protein
MRKAIVLVFATALIVFHSKAEPPSPIEVANTVSNFWFGNNLSSLSVYATNLYSDAMTNYLPAVLLSAFHDHLFAGKLMSASNKFERVRFYVSGHPQEFTEFFKGILVVVSGMSGGDIAMFRSMGLNPAQLPGTHISPQAVRDDGGSTFMPPHIAILYLAPAATIP